MNGGDTLRRSVETARVVGSRKNVQGLNLVHAGERRLSQILKRRKLGFDHDRWSSRKDQNYWLWLKVAVIHRRDMWLPVDVLTHRKPKFKTPHFQVTKSWYTKPRISLAWIAFIILAPRKPKGKTPRFHKLRKSQYMKPQCTLWS